MNRLYLDLIHALPHLSNVNQKKLFMKPPINSRFFVIKSFNEQNVHKSIKYNIWASTKQGHQKLNSAFLQSSERNGEVYLFFSVNGNQQFMGVARMITQVDFTHNFNLWTQKKKFEGFFKLEWIYIKDIANKYFRKILIPANQNKPVTNSRDCQQIPYSQGSHMLKTYHNFNPQTSLLDEYDFYQKRQQDQEMRKQRNLMKKNKQQRKSSGTVTPPNESSSNQAQDAHQEFTSSPHRLNPEMKIFTRNPNHPSYQKQNEKKQDSKNQSSSQILTKGLSSELQQQKKSDDGKDQFLEHQGNFKINITNSPPESYSSILSNGIKSNNVYNCSSQGRSLSPINVFNVDQNDLAQAIRRNFTSGKNTDESSLKAQQFEYDDYDDQRSQEEGEMLEIVNQRILIQRGQQSANFNFPSQTPSIIPQKNHHHSICSPYQVMIQQSELIKEKEREQEDAQQQKQRDE